MVMSMNLIKDYLNQTPFKMMIDEEKIYILNYKRLISLEDDYISIITSKKKINIKGLNLSLRRIQQEELLIEGTIKEIEVLDEIKTKS